VRSLTGTPDAQVAALGELLGMTPGSRMDKTVAVVALAAEAQSRGITWNQIAASLGVANGKEAKAAIKRLAKIAQRKMLATAASTDTA
jgi:hypothetical protein